MFLLKLFSQIEPQIVCVDVPCQEISLAGIFLDALYKLFRFLLINTILFFIQNYFLYKTSKKANLKYSMLSFIPFFNLIPMCHLINISGGYMLLQFIPFAKPFLNVYLFSKIFQRFQLKPSLCILGVFFPIIIFTYVFTKNLNYYSVDINPSYKNLDFKGMNF